MNIRIAIFAACASTLALAQADVAWANYGSTSNSKNPVSITDIVQVPAIRYAGNGATDYLTDGLRINDNRKAKTDTALPKTQKQKTGAGGATIRIDNEYMTKNKK
jgi:hypothetical protein